MNKIFNIANFLTFLRIVLSIPLWVILNNINNNSSNSIISYFLILCLIIALTDIFDGFAARYFESVTDLGKFLDPIADKICALVMILFLSIKFGIYYYILFVIVLIRDIIISVVSIYFASKKNIYFQANTYGKWFLFFIATCMILSVVRIPNSINYNYPYLGMLNALLYLLSWIFFILATFRYFSNYVKVIWRGDV